MPTVHVLDNPVWHALTGPQATVAQGAPPALRYQPDVTPFGALPDAVTGASWDALERLVGAGGIAVLFRARLESPPGWEPLFAMHTLQMVAGGPSAFAMAPDDRELVLELLGPADVDEMLALVERTRPGPFLPRTVELGTYLGVRERGALVAMAGERMHLDGFTEVSAVCTDERHRGRGLGAALVRAIGREVVARGETPILHVLATNTTAIALYEKLGFERRTEFEVTGLRAP